VTDTLLLIDDEPAILRVVGTGLRARGYRVVTASSGQDGVTQAEVMSPAVIILDLGLPDIDGVEVCRRIRQSMDTPILVLSAHGTEQRKVAALDEGADDFVTKPFGMAELAARIRVALRHRARYGGAGGEPGHIELGSLVVDMGSRAVTVEGRGVDLTAREFDFLAYLARHAGKVVTHRVLLEAVWGPGYGTETHYLRVYANHLRKKIEADPANPRYLRTSPGVGYQLVAPAEPAPA
jgi:two-component system KDP operon response regulator KdpE